MVNSLPTSRPAATAPPSGRAKAPPQDEIPQHGVIIGADQCRRIPDRTKIGLDRLPLDRSLLDFELGENLLFGRELVGEAVALRLPPFVVRGPMTTSRLRPGVLCHSKPASTQPTDRRRAQGDGTELNDIAGAA